MTIQDQIKVMQHYADGGEVQIKNSCNGEWVDTDDPWWQWLDSEYRIKPSPELRPFTLEEAHRLVGRVVRLKDNHEYIAQILVVRRGVEREVVFDLRYKSESAQFLLNYYELFNSVTGEWGPCGMEVVP